MELYPTVVPPAVFLHSLFAKEGAGGSSESGVVAEELTVFAAVFGRTHPLSPPLFVKARGKREEVDCFTELYPTSALLRPPFSLAKRKPEGVQRAMWWPKN